MENFDGVIRIGKDEVVLLEFTEEHDLGKVRGDIHRIAPVKMQFAIKGIICRGYIVLKDEPTRSMREAGEAQHISVCSIAEFERDFFDFASYAHLRELRQYGSAVDPITGKTDVRPFVSVDYIDKEKGIALSFSQLADQLISGHKFVLVGDYGTGKSRCVREVFQILREKTQEAGAFPLAINLREHWGSRTAIEILTGHLSSIGLSTSFDNAIRLLNAGHLTLLLDGFDELGAQTFDYRREDRTSIRSHALEGVRDLIARNKGGLLITGRSHYFDTDAELLSCLGLGDAKHSVRLVQSPDNFSIAQAHTYLREIGVTASVPEWLPRKPLIFQILATIDSQAVTALLAKDYGQFTFWGSFVQAVCRREADMHPSLSPSAVHRVLLELAHVTRVHDEYLGRLTPVDISAAYQRALGGAPDDSGRQMLARLCMLGRLEQESADRQFIDVNVIDVLRAERLVIDIFRMEDDEFTAKPWKQPLRITGLVYAASQIDSCDLEPLCLSYIGKFGDSNNRQKLAELISALATLGPGKLDLRGLNLANIEIPMLTLGFREIANLVIKNSIIGVVGLENSKVQTNSNLFLESCLFTMISGISGSIGLPAWIIRPEVIEYDGLTNVSRIRDSSVSPEHKFFLSIIHKIFFQAGAGREEASLMKGGFGQQFNPKIVESILKLLTREGLIEKGKGDDGFVYRPVRRHTERMARIKAELSLSADVLWEEIGKLKH